MRRIGRQLNSVKGDRARSARIDCQTMALTAAAASARRGHRVILPFILDLSNRSEDKAE